MANYRSGNLRSPGAVPTNTEGGVLDFFDPRVIPSLDRNWFPPRYFTGCDVQFVFGRRDPADAEGVVDIYPYLEDDILDFQFTAGQPKRPIYSYASFRFDRVAKGQILIEGQFAIPFTKKFRMFEAMMLAKQDQLSGLGSSFPANTNTAKQSSINVWESLSVEDKIKAIERGDLRNTAMIEAMTAGITSAEDLGKALSDLPDDHMRTDRWGISDDGLEIVIYYGGADPTAQESFAYLAKNKFKRDEKVLALHKVHISHNTQVIRPKGAPVLEQYSFIAWDYS